MPRQAGWMPTGIRIAGEIALSVHAEGVTFMCIFAKQVDVCAGVFICVWI